MKHIVMMITAIACMSMVAMPVHAEKVDGVKVKKEKKVKAPKAPKEKKPKAEKSKPVFEEVVLSGTIAKQEKTGKNEKVMVKYVLTDSEGNKFTLPTPKAGKKKKQDPVAAAINLDDYLDTGVKVTGQGRKMEKKGKIVVQLKKITRIEKGGSVADIEVFSPPSE